MPLGGRQPLPHNLPLYGHGGIPPLSSRAGSFLGGEKGSLGVGAGTGEPHLARLIGAAWDGEAGGAGREGVVTGVRIIVGIIGGHIWKDKSRWLELAFLERPRDSHSCRALVSTRAQRLAHCGRPSEGCCPSPLLTWSRPSSCAQLTRDDILRTVRPACGVGHGDMSLLLLLLTPPVAKEKDQHGCQQSGQDDDANHGPQGGVGGWRSGNHGEGVIGAACESFN